VAVNEFQKMITALLNYSVIHRIKNVCGNVAAFFTENQICSLHDAERSKTKIISFTNDRI